MEGRCKLSSSLGLALLFLGSFLIFNSFHLNMFSLPWGLNSSINTTKWNASDISDAGPGPALTSFPPGNGNGELHARIVDGGVDVNRTVYNLTLLNGDDRPGNWSDGGSVKEVQNSAMRVVPKVEIELRRARIAIRKAGRFHNVTFNRTRDILRGGIYRNAYAFQQSYAEMEKRFKMFVYSEGEPPLVHGGPCKNIYSIEGRFIHELELGNPFLTSNPEEAHVFFLPFSVVRMVSYIYEPKTYDLAPLRRFVSDYIQVLANKYPFWNRSLGTDHFMLSCHDWGPLTSMANPYLYNNSIRVLCNANTSEGFNPAKDATLPEVNLKTGLTAGLLGGQSALRRPLLAFFAGGNHGPVRPLLFNHWKDKDGDIQVKEYLPKEVSYYDMMRKSKYCLCPSGYEVASPRIVEAIYNECVPVILSKHYALPFSDVLNWDAFSVQVPLSEIPNLKTILQSISPKRYVQMQRRVKQVQKHFVINQPPRPFDLFHMILHSIWLRRLNVQITQ